MPEPARHDEGLRPAFKERLQRVIGEAAAEEAAAALDRLGAALPLAIARDPQPALVMITAADSFETPFYLGELLVTTAEATLEGFRGLGITAGEAPERALLLAAVEAAEAAGREADLAPLAGLVAELERRRRTREAREAQITAATAVRFESMRRERVDFGSLGD